MKNLPEHLITTKHASIAQVREDILITCVGLRASATPYTSDTGRKVGRLRWPGKGRKGVQLRVYDTITKLYLFEHTTSETYRTVAEATAWLAKWKRANPTRVRPFAYVTKADVSAARAHQRSLFGARDGAPLAGLDAYTFWAESVGAWNKTTRTEK